MVKTILIEGSGGAPCAHPFFSEEPDPASGGSAGRATSSKELEYAETGLRAVARRAGRKACWSG